MDSLRDLKCTDLVSLVPWFRGKSIPYACKVNKSLSPEAERFFMETLREGVDAGKYVHIYSEWNAPIFIVYKPAALKMNSQELLEAVRTDPKDVYHLTQNYRFLNRQVTHPEYVSS